MVFSNVDLAFIGDHYSRTLRTDSMEVGLDNNQMTSYRFFCLSGKTAAVFSLCSLQQYN